MDKKPYSNREIDNMHKEIMDKLKIIDTKVTIANGRLKSLELWRAYLTGAIAVLTLIVVPVAIALVNRLFGL